VAAIAAALVLSSTLVATEAAVATTAPTPVVQGNKLVDSQTNAVFVPHGVNIPGLEYSCVQGWRSLPAAGEFAAVASWKVNTVRLPLNESCWLGLDGAPSGSTVTQYKADVKAWVDGAVAAGLVVILDLHWNAPAGYTASGQRAMPDERSASFWTSVATTYAANKSVLFELFNEPYSRSGFTLTWSCWKNGGCLAPVENDATGTLSGSKYTVTGMQTLVSAVRTAGATQPLLLGGLNYSNDLSGWIANKPTDPLNQLVAAWHNYPGQGCSTTCWNSTVTTVAANVPIVTTEFGNTAETTSTAANNSGNYLVPFMTWADAHGIGYLPWAWWDVGAAEANGNGSDIYALYTGPSFTPKVPSGTKFKNYLASLTGVVVPSPVGVSLIDQAYARWGGASGALGAVVGSPTPIAENGGGLVQGYQNGAIAWSPSRGAFAVMGEIRTYFGGQGGVAGLLGWPASDPVAVAAAGGGTVQSFAGGAVAASPSGVFSLVGSVRSFFNTIGGIGGALGWPSADRSCSPAGVCTQSFAGGVAYVQPSGSGQYLLPAFHTAYVAAGGPSGPLGWPATGPIHFSASGGGTVQGFAGGALAGADGAAAYTLTGVMRSAYNSAGGVTSELGWPSGDSSCTAGVCTQQYQNGTIFWSARYGARASVGAIAVAYATLGATSSTLGWPVTGMISVAAGGGGRVQGFQQGAIAASAAGAFVLSGATRDYYNTIGGLGGPLGWPAGALTCAATTCTQQFASGTLYWSAATGGRYSTGPIAAAYNAQGGPAGPSGWPTTGMLAFTANGGGTVQGFQGAAFASSAAGTYSLSGGVRSFYNTKGGVTGPLGWPTGAMTCTAAVCTQPFAGGTISYDPATGATVI
jgi:uncharacterized protein with LGFP repeats